MSSVKRVFFYLVSLVTLGIFVAGIRTLLNLLFEFVLPGGIAVTGRYLQDQLSLGIAMMVIGGPLWFFFWRAIIKSIASDARETGTTSRKLYLNLVLLAASIGALLSLSGIIKWMLGGFPADGDPSNSIAVFISSAATWYYHWRIAEAELGREKASNTFRRWYIYIISAWGLIWLVAGLVQLIHAAAGPLFDTGTLIAGSSFWRPQVQENIAWIICGGGFWYFHWFRMAKEDADSTLRQVYIYLLAISGGAIAGLTALTMMLYLILNRVFGTATVVANYFDPLGWQIPLIITAAAVWAYHQALARNEAGALTERRLSSRRIHLYIMSLISLGTLTAGIVILVGLLWDLMLNALQISLIANTGYWRSQLSLGLSLLIVAIPIWLYYWTGVIRLCQAGGLVEWKARSRRFYLYFIVVVTILGLTADLVNIIYQLLSGGLTEGLGVNTLSAIKWSIQSLVVAAPLLYYHWSIVREDQHRGAEKAAIKKAVMMVAPENAGEAASQIEARLGSKIKKLLYLGIETGIPVLNNEDLDRIAGQVLAIESNKVLLLIYEGKVLVLPYEEK